ncbi:MAG: rhomboid family intramembrane serine protease [Verrucomicrobia bacterium]|nr:rhomboid family intramembrane serine protease [Verrucomicrobiota bacterium]
MNAPIKITYNAPFVLTYSLICLVVLLVSGLTDGKSTLHIFSVHGSDSLSNPLVYLRMVGHTMGHINFSHLLGNLTIILLIGPILEEKYGSRDLTIMALITAGITGLLHMLFFEGMLLGASGIVFMFIVLSSLVNVKRKTVPLTFILVCIIFLGNEFLLSFEEDSVSQFAHILGGICGSVFGFFRAK